MWSLNRGWLGYGRKDPLVVGLAKFRPAVSVDKGTRMNRDVLMNDVARHARGGCKRHLLGFDLALDGARDLDFVAIDGALDLRVAADLHGHATHIAVDL